MKLNKTLSIAFSFGLLGLAACTQDVIVFKPSPYIDPMPDNAVATPQVEVAKVADPRFNEQWNLKKIGVKTENLDSRELAGYSSVKVAVLSTGVDYNHEDLIGKIAVNRKEITQEAAGDIPGANRQDDDGNGLIDDIVGYDVVDGDGLAYDRHGAGTAVAGIIAATRNNGKGISGVAGNVTIYPIRYINDNGQSTTASLVAALDIAESSGADIVYIQSLEILLGGQGQDAEVIAIELNMADKSLKALREKKVPVIVGAGDDMGNFGSSDLQKMFLRYDNVFVVTSSDENDTLPLLANVDAQGVKTMAPGENILTTQPRNQYGTVSGTAYAAAHVAGGFALAKALYGSNLDYTDYSAALISAAGSDVVPGLDRFTRGGNRFNVVKFLNKLRER